MRQFQLLQGDAENILTQFNDNTFHCCVTSPPYWQLRNYFVDNQLGHEKSPDEYIERLVKIFNQVKRTLRKDGILWVVIGDTYVRSDMKVKLKNKNLLGIPWKLAFALQDDGWILRNDIIFAKKNPMPDGAKDRPTRSHEYIFMLTKNQKYFYDYYSSLEKSNKKVDGIQRFGARNQIGTYRHDQKRTFEHFGKRNTRSVWNHSVASFQGKHFAVFSPGLIDKCVKFSTSREGYCLECKSPWKRILKKSKVPFNNEKGYDLKLSSIGWEPSCNCDIEEKISGIVLDPFCGTSTTGIVAFKYGLNYVGIDVNEDYLKISENILDDNDIFVERMRV